MKRADVEDAASAVGIINRAMVAAASGELSELGLAAITGAVNKELRALRGYGAFADRADEKIREHVAEIVAKTERGGS